MKYCQNCGKEANDAAKFCEYCGNQFNLVRINEQENTNNSNVINNLNNGSNNINVNNQNQSNINESNTMGICAIVFAFVIPLVGLILSIMILATKKDYTTRKYGKIGLIISIITFIINVTITIIYIAFTMSYIY